MTGNKYRVLDSFAGAGGFSLGFEQAGCEVVGGIELDEWASDTFRSNHNNAEVLTGDITKMSDELLIKTFGKRKPNVLLGGPPCQGYSICNVNAGDPKDPRNSLFVEFIRLAKIFDPEIVVMENVPNIIKAKTGNSEKVVEIIKSELEGLGYLVKYKILHADHFGVPQMRKRLFVIGVKQEIENFFPEPTHSFEPKNDLFSPELKKTPSLWDAISDLPQIAAREGAEESEYFEKPINDYQKSLRNGNKVLFNHKSMSHSKRMVERFASMSWGESVSDVPDHLKPYKRNGNGEISGKAYDQNNRRLHPERLCHTIPASFYANFVHPYCDRNFTAREGARLQSFPDDFIFKGKPTVVSRKLLEKEGRLHEKHLGQYNQIGNAVPPLLAKSVAQNLISQL